MGITIRPLLFLLKVEKADLDYEAMMVEKVNIRSELWKKNLFFEVYRKILNFIGVCASPSFKNWTITYPPISKFLNTVFFKYLLIGFLYIK